MSEPKRPFDPHRFMGPNFRRKIIREGNAAIEAWRRRRERDYLVGDPRRDIGQAMLWPAAGVDDAGDDGCPPAGT